MWVFCLARFFFRLVFVFIFSRSLLFWFRILYSIDLLVFKAFMWSDAASFAWQISIALLRVYLCVERSSSRVLSSKIPKRRQSINSNSRMQSQKPHVFAMLHKTETYFSINSQGSWFLRLNWNLSKNSCVCHPFCCDLRLHQILFHCKFAWHQFRYCEGVRHTCIPLVGLVGRLWHNSYSILASTFSNCLFDHHRLWVA